MKCLIVADIQRVHFRSKLYNYGPLKGVSPKVMSVPRQRLHAEESQVRFGGGTHWGSCLFASSSVICHISLCYKNAIVLQVWQGVTKGRKHCLKLP